MYSIKFTCSQKNRPHLAANIIFREVVNVLINGLGWLCLVEFRFQVTETAVAAQNFDSLLLDGGGSYSEILQTGESWVLHVCEVKLEKQKFTHST